MQKTVEAWHFIIFVKGYLIPSAARAPIFQDLCLLLESCTNVALPQVENNSALMALLLLAFQLARI